MFKNLVYLLGGFVATFFLVFMALKTKRADSAQLPSPMNPSRLPRTAQFAHSSSVTEIESSSAVHRSDSEADTIGAYNEARDRAGCLPDPSEITDDLLKTMAISKDALLKLMTRNPLAAFETQRTIQNLLKPVRNKVRECLAALGVSSSLNISTVWEAEITSDKILLVSGQFIRAVGAEISPLHGQIDECIRPTLAARLEKDADSGKTFLEFRGKIPHNFQFTPPAIESQTAISPSERIDAK